MDKRLADILQHQLQTLNDYARECHQANLTWWLDPTTGQPKKRDVLGLLMLCVTEIAEAAEGYRKNVPDTHLPHRSMFEVELVDTLIRIFDLAGALNLDLSGAFREKMAYNARRLDHTLAARAAPGGKRY